MGSPRSGAEGNDPPKKGDDHSSHHHTTSKTSSSMTKETTINPSWKQLRQIPESLLKHQILRALGLNPPDEGVADRFVIRESIEEVIKSEQGFIYFSPHRCCYLTGDDLLKRVKLPKGTDTGDAFRQWLRAKGWVPKSERMVGHEQKNTNVTI